MLALRGGEQTARPVGPRTTDGRPDSGVWQALNEANWDLEPHAARASRVLGHAGVPNGNARS